MQKNEEMEGLYPSSENKGPKVYSVGQLTEAIRDLLENKFDFIWVEGEISNFTAAASGHYYMVLKDEKAQIRTVMFRLQARYLKFVPENGMKVLAQGKLGVYSPRGEYQIILDYLEPMGVGALALAFEQLKKKLSEKGLFDQSIKKPLPFLPQHIAVITSPTGAAVQDFLKIAHRRFANLEVIVVPVRVQGEEAASDMVKALEMVNSELPVDVIVITRGGGSMEDLWAFNEEKLALAIRESQIPVVSAVGHEIDVTICDLAADFRAPTPSAAAELIVLEKESLLRRLGELSTRLRGSMDVTIHSRLQALNKLAMGLKDPRRQLDDIWMRLDDVYGRLIRSMDLRLEEGKRRLSSEYRALRLYSPIKMVNEVNQKLGFQKITFYRAMKNRLKDSRIDLSHLQKRIEDLSPLSILKRGYSITLKLPGKNVLTDATGVETGDRVQVLLEKGELGCRVERVEQK